ncbi:MAG: hypothetical protein EP329_01195 [Deltaproteobacteria bacterium]|nr:MAG: hypothetical protein EP329_01195 [Deltaproteobacteria bacterium]
MPRGIVGTLIAAAALAGCLAEAPAEPDARLAIAVAPLTLDGVTNATYTLTVLNSAGDTVWTRTVDSQGYGDGSGSLSYVGTCDADANPNRVQLVVDELEANGAPLVSGVDWVNPAPAGDPLERLVDCAANVDAAVTFDLALARAATQGFFDVAVSFQDVFCSAKLDCQRDEGAGLVDLAFLANPLTGARDLTAVLAFACTAGPGQDTVLHMNPIAVACTSGGLTAQVDPSAGPGNLDPAFDGPLPNTTQLLFQAAAYRGDEQLGTNHKAYWNVALGLNRDAFAVGGTCRLTASATVSDGPFDGGFSPVGTRWPYVSWDVVVFDGGALTCAQHEVGGGDGVAVVYGATSGISFAASFDGLSGLVTQNPATNECLVDNGGCGANSTCTDTLEGRDCGCVAGFDDCNGSLADGCEVALATDHEDCGVCGNPCAADEICDAGSCVAPCTAPRQVLTYTGALQTVTVPTGCTFVAAKLWGGGGGGIGGSGGFASGDVTVSAGATLAVVVAGGGGPADVANGSGGAGGYGGGGKGGAGAGSFYQGGGGGGYSGLFAASVSQANALLMAGGGGGSGHSGATSGGVGGGTAGDHATNNGICYPVVGAGGGTQTAGGQPTGIVAGNSRWYQGGAGGALSGGYGGPPYNQWGGGGGGGGYFGGGGGNGDDGWNFCNYGGSGSAGSSGGGGSGRIHPTLVANGALVAGLAGGQAPNDTDPDYVAGVATAGTGASGVGGVGLVVLDWGFLYTP